MWLDFEKTNKQFALLGITTSQWSFFIVKTHLERLGHLGVKG